VFLHSSVSFDSKFTRKSDGKPNVYTGADGVIHMCEEVEDPEVEVPRSLVVSICINGFLGIGMMLIMLFCIGDVQDALTSPTGFPFIQIFQQALPDSTAFTTGLASLLLVLLVSAVVAVTAAASRVTWAFARDDGLPGSSYLKEASVPRSNPT